MLVLLNLQKEKKEGKSEERRPFDRNIDLQANRFDEAQKKAIFKKAQLLDDRFSSGRSKFLWVTVIMRKWNSCGHLRYFPRNSTHVPTVISQRSELQWNFYFMQSDVTFFKVLCTFHLVPSRLPIRMILNFNLFFFHSNLYCMVQVLTKKIYPILHLQCSLGNSKKSWCHFMLEFVPVK